MRPLAKRHGPVASDDGLNLRCKCGYEPEYQYSLFEFLTLAEQDADIERHTQYVTLKQQEVTDYLAKKRAVTFLKEVDNG